MRAFPYEVYPPTRLQGEVRVAALPPDIEYRADRAAANGLQLPFIVRLRPEPRGRAE